MSIQSRTEKENVDQFSTPNFTCDKTITTLTGNFELIIILIHIHNIMFYKEH